MAVTSNSEDDTRAFGEKLAALLRPGDVLCLYGDLGSGKTVLARAIIRALSANPGREVPSPTFTLVQNYDDVSPAPLWHFDLYRVKDAEELYELGWEDALFGGILLIEWPERLEHLAPEDRLDIVFETTQQNRQRKIALIPHGRWQGRNEIDGLSS